MKVITNVRTKVRENDKLIIFFLEGEEKPVFLSAKQVTAGTELQGNYGVLRGSKLGVSYFEEGETLSNGNECTKANTIIKEFEFELSNQLIDLAGAAAYGMAFKK